MKRKISAAILLLTLMMMLFSCAQPPSEPATQLSDKDSAQIKDDFDLLEGKLSEAESLKTENNTASFSAQLSAKSSDAVAYNGSEDITIDSAEASGKTVTVTTTGSVTLSSPVDTLIIGGADKGFTAEARAESIILEGNGITAEIRSASGVILVKGKNITVNVSNSSVEKLIVINVSTKVNNLTDEDIKVTLANGAKITVPAKHVYNTNDNTVQKK